MDDNLFAGVGGSDGSDFVLDTTGFDLAPATETGYFENAAEGNDFDWTGSDLTPAELETVGNYLQANPDALDALYQTGFFGNVGNSLLSAGKSAASWMGSLFGGSGSGTGALGVGALLASGMLSSKDAEKLVGVQTQAQKDLLQYKHDLEKPTAWVTPASTMRLR